MPTDSGWTTVSTGAKYHDDCSSFSFGRFRNKSTLRGCDATTATTRSATSAGGGLQLWCSTNPHKTRSPQVSGMTNCPEGLQAYGKLHGMLTGLREPRTGCVLNTAWSSTMCVPLSSRMKERRLHTGCYDDTRLGAHAQGSQMGGEAVSRRTVFKVDAMMPLLDGAWSGGAEDSTHDPGAAQSTSSSAVGSPIAAASVCWYRVFSNTSTAGGATARSASDSAVRTDETTSREISSSTVRPTAPWGAMRPDTPRKDRCRDVGSPLLSWDSRVYSGCYCADTDPCTSATVRSEQ